MELKKLGDARHFGSGAVDPWSCVTGAAATLGSGALKAGRFARRRACRQTLWWIRSFAKLEVVSEHVCREAHGCLRWFKNWKMRVTVVQVPWTYGIA